MWYSRPGFSHVKRFLEMFIYGAAVPELSAAINLFFPADDSIQSAGSPFNPKMRASPNPGKGMSARILCRSPSLEMRSSIQSRGVADWRLLREDTRKWCYSFL
jgi:hypothetical protein